MPIHPGSAISVALLVAAAVITGGYHVARGRQSGRRPPKARSTRPHAWLPTARVMTAVFVLLVALFAAAFSAGS